MKQVDFKEFEAQDIRKLIQCITDQPHRVFKTALVFGHNLCDSLFVPEVGPKNYNKIRDNFNKVIAKVADKLDTDDTLEIHRAVTRTILRIVNRNITSTNDKELITSIIIKKVNSINPVILNK